MRKFYEELKTLSSHYQSWLFAVLFALMLVNGMRACNRGRQLSRIEKRMVELKSRNDSVVKAYTDSITELKHRIEVLDVENRNFTRSLEMQQEAMNQINEAKKNIKVELTTLKK